MENPYINIDKNYYCPVDTGVSKDAQNHTQNPYITNVNQVQNGVDPQHLNPFGMGVDPQHANPFGVQNAPFFAPNAPFASNGTPNFANAQYGMNQANAPYGTNQANAPYGTNPANAQYGMNQANAPYGTNDGLHLPFLPEGFNTAGLLRGLVIGGIAAYILSNPKTQEYLFKAIIKGGSLINAGIEELKERFEDVKAEIDANK